MIQNPANAFKKYYQIFIIRDMAIVKTVIAVE